MKKKKEQPILENITITDIGAEGKAIARVDGMVVFVPYVVPGDVADIKILKKKKNYAEGKAVAIHSSPTGGCRPNAPISAPAAAAAGRPSTTPTSWPPSSSR